MYSIPRRHWPEIWSCLGVIRSSLIRFVCIGVAPPQLVMSRQYLLSFACSLTSWGRATPRQAKWAAHIWKKPTLPKPWLMMSMTRLIQTQWSCRKNPTVGFFQMSCFSDPTLSKELLPRIKTYHIRHRIGIVCKMFLCILLDTKISMLSISVIG